MKKTALDAFVERYNANGGWVTTGNLEYQNYIFLYAGSYFGYVWKKTDRYEWGDPDTEREYGWNSFEDFLNDAMTEVGMTFREGWPPCPPRRLLFLSNVRRRLTAL